MALILAWLLYCLLGVVIFAVLFLWAVRNGQFRDQERARHLPLQREDGARQRSRPRIDAQERLADAGRPFKAQRALACVDSSSSSWGRSPSPCRSSACIVSSSSLR